MAIKQKKLSNPFSTGGGGGHFEAHIQSSFIVLMLTGGFAPCLPSWPIKEVKLQGKIDGYNTDDLVVFVEHEQSGEVRKLLGQVKHSISFTQGAHVLEEVLYGAWNDFNNNSLFQRKKDVIALITGPISTLDQGNVQWLLHHAKHTKNATEFYRDVTQANFSPSKSEEKLDVFRHHLKNANGGTQVTDDDLYEFLNHFYVLGYDLGGETGVVLPLLHSHISQFQNDYPKMVWGRIVELVQTWNQHAGTVTREKLPDDLLEVFSKKTVIEKMPESLQLKKENEKTDWKSHPSRAEIALVVLLGGWDENNENDKMEICKLLNMQYEVWQPKARDILHEPDSPLKLKNGVWTITRKEELLSLLGSLILDSNIDSFERIAESVLIEEDPALDLEQEKRSFAKIDGIVIRYSEVLRQGIAEGLALIGSHAGLLINCTPRKSETVALIAVRNLLTDASWQRWATLNKLLPDIAEASPGEFLNQVDSALSKTPKVFKDIFGQEGSGISGRNYLTGLLWALEGIAWDEEYLIRVCCILADLATLDPGGQWVNRPINSIITILLPWLPQTLARVEKRKIAVKTITKETPSIGWKLLLQLLPEQHQTSSGTHKPKWRNTILKNYEKSVSQEEYLDQVTFYSELAVDVAENDLERTAELIDYFAHLTGTAFDKFISTLSAFKIDGLSEESKRQIWDSLNRFVTKHRKFSDANWTLPEELLSRIDTVSSRFSPTNPIHVYQHLFSDRDFDLYDERGNWEEQRKKLEKKREAAIHEIFSVYGLKGVIEFLGSVTSSREVGRGLATFSDSDIDTALLPSFLLSEDPKQISFIASYVWQRCYLSGWEWVDNISKEEWTKVQLAQFLAFLPFEQKAWDRALLLKSDENEYWLRTPANAYQRDGDLNYAIDKLIEFGRPKAAIDCIGRLLAEKQPVDNDQIIQALLSGLNSDEPRHPLDQYHVVELIKHIQSDTQCNELGLFKVEWAYLPLLVRDQDVEPTLLENKLATDPGFFCELIQILYRSKNEKENSQPISSEKQAIAKNAWKLLHQWHTPPGSKKGEHFDDKAFKKWVKIVKTACRKSGHYEVAMICLGNVLIHAPMDDSGLWINTVIAEELNAKGSEEIRQGYYLGILNSRGAHFVDPSGKPEMELAEQFRIKADGVENEGFHRFSTTLRDIAADYELQANRNIQRFDDK